ncbi:CDP-alcohol phosphatidyltransferase family protein [Senegalimassilia anaerobia]|uniref:CDP-alcohol phosphatidyltransferase family protein n=1 Tax=Senegalimassilia anaerobia TaxID=1473216 RepID=A0A369LB66_9ACTN|nr:CDP-alcohol phosphatidyltransferase family protein [Senegalimassilia anaerobia]MBL6462895.1 CDP-alcohol phosphatidyltransferase family protein [Senegalimassilia sp.]RDB55395.1 CDP-alcohol phosphatidyltransferase family protein [Senegalimassilia anaerobia]
MSSQKTEAVTNRIFTIPNVISFIRLCMVPVYMVLLLNGYDLLATFMFALAAGTDWIDGQLARRTNCVSKLGQLLDPAVDRILMSCGVIGLMLVGRLPIWIVVVVLGRDLMLLVGGAYLLKRYHERVAVIYPGKVATTFLFVGFAGLLLNMPLIGGLGWFEASWLPGFGSEACSWGIWFVYAGLLLGLFTTLYYVLAGYRKMQKARRLEAKGRVR